MTLDKAFKLRLEHYLKDRNITIHKFVKDGAIARSTITNLLQGNSKSPTLTTLYQVANALDITVLEFLDCDLFRDENIDF